MSAQRNSKLMPFISKYLHKFQDHDENAGLKFPPRSRGESENRKEGGGVEEVKEQEKRGLHVKGVCLRVVSNSTFETWSQLYRSSELYQKSEPGRNSEIDQKSELEQNSENKQLVQRVRSSERLLEDVTELRKKCKNESEKSLNNGGTLNNQRDYYNFQIISQV